MAGRVHIMENHLNRAKLNIVSSLINQLVTTVCGIIIPRILIVTYGSEAYGMSVSISQFLSYISLLEGGIGAVARAKLYSPLTKNDNYGISVVYGAEKRFFFHVAELFALYSLFLGAAYRDLAHITVYSRLYIISFVLIISMATLAKYMGGLANLTLIVADQKQYVHNFMAMTVTIANAVIVLIMAHCRFDLIWVKLGSSIIFIIRPWMLALYVRKHYNLVPVDDKDTRDVLNQKWTGIGQHIAYFLHRNTDIVLLTLFADLRLVAVYSVYSLVVNSIRTITESFSSGMEAVFGEFIAADNKGRLIRAYHKYQTLMDSASMILFSCTGSLIVPFVILYTEGIADADYKQPIFALILVLAEAVNCIVLPCASLPIAADQLKRSRIGAYGEAVINIVLSCILIRWSPLVGVALGTLGATVFRGIYYICYASRFLLRISARKLLLRFAAVCSVIGFLSIGGAKILSLVHIESYFVWLCYGVLVFAIVAIPMLLLTRWSLKTAEQRDIKQ